MQECILCDVIMKPDRGNRGQNKIKDLCVQNEWRVVQNFHHQGRSTGFSNRGGENYLYMQRTSRELANKREVLYGRGPLGAT